MSATVGDVVHKPRVELTPIQRGDLTGGLIDPRVVSVLAAIAERHTAVVTALRSEHSRLTVDGAVSNHSAGRAVDIGAVDGEVCRGTRSGRCADLLRELVAMSGPLRSTELIYCWDPDGPAIRVASRVRITATTSMWGSTDERRCPGRECRRAGGGC